MRRRQALPTGAGPHSLRFSRSSGEEKPGFRLAVESLTFLPRATTRSFANSILIGVLGSVESRNEEMSSFEDMYGSRDDPQEVAERYQEQPHRQGQVRHLR
jgi:hypothetical protein